MAVNVKSVLIIGGGTGGHISPGISLYSEFRDRGINTLFLTGKRDARFSSLSEINGGDLHYYNPPSMTKNPFKLPLFSVKFLSAVMRTKKLIKKNSVSAVIGMGGYASAPALMAARLAGVPLFLCEQNTVPGRVTRLFEKTARKIYSTFAESVDYLKFPEKIFHAGNPIRKGIVTAMTKDEAKKMFHLTQSKKVIFAIGGSQGATRINELIFGLKQKYSDDLKNIGIIWSTGGLTYDAYKEKLQEMKDQGSVYLSPFISNVGAAYKACDLAISRSGAGVMMELAAMGIPSILIPYPFAAMNHQEKNAEVFANSGASVMVSDSDAVPEKIAPIIFDLLGNSRVLASMSEKSRTISRPDAAVVIADDIMREIGGQGIV